ncbi:hypothetical protein PSPO01_08393 [Paraphaeosphaeria sporulosa]
MDGRIHSFFSIRLLQRLWFRSYKPDRSCSPLTKVLPHGHVQRHSRGTWSSRVARCATWRLCGSAIEMKQDSAVLLYRPQGCVPVIEGESRRGMLVRFSTLCTLVVAPGLRTVPQDMDTDLDPCAKCASSDLSVTETSA